VERIKKSDRTTRVPPWRKYARALAALSLLWLSAGCAMHRGSEALGERIAQAAVHGGAQPEMAMAAKLPNWSAPVSVAARPMPTSATMVAVSPPATRLAALTPNQPAADATPVAAPAPIPAVAPQVDHGAVDQGTVAQHTTDQGVKVLAMPPTLVLPPPEPGPRLSQGATRPVAPTETPAMSPEHAATEAAALTAAIPLPDPLPLPFVNRAVPVIGPGDVVKPQAASARHSSALPVNAVSGPRTAALPTRQVASSASSPAPSATKPAGVRGTVLAAPVPVPAVRQAAANRTAAGAAPHTKAAAKTARHGAKRPGEKVAAAHTSRRHAKKAAAKRVKSRVANKSHVAEEQVVARRTPARPARTATHESHGTSDRIADRDSHRPTPVGASDKARAVTAPAAGTGDGAPGHGGWIGPLAPGSTAKVGVTHSSALEQPRKGLSLSLDSAAERLKSWAIAGWTRVSPHDRTAQTAAARQHDAAGSGARRADSG
jgi:hypothetical protein